jgi:hypothetical protein
MDRAAFRVLQPRDLSKDEELGSDIVDLLAWHLFEGNTSVLDTFAADDIQLLRRVLDLMVAKSLLCQCEPVPTMSLKDMTLASCTLHKSEYNALGKDMVD